MDAVLLSSVQILLGVVFVLIGIGAMIGIDNMRKAYLIEAAALDAKQKSASKRLFRSISFALVYLLFMLFPVVFMLMGVGVFLLTILPLPFALEYRLLICVSGVVVVFLLHRALRAHYHRIFRVLSWFRGFGR
ncbi:TPA: hypothetical protein HA251_07300 [Candidatus Woesearchaeota archaeon]|nr:hypothetical protein [Candidatus Woesearchaeota archaeon]